MHRAKDSTTIAVSDDADYAIPIEPVDRSALLLASKNSSGGKIVRLNVMFVDGFLHLGDSQLLHPQFSARKSKKRIPERCRDLRDYARKIRE